MKVTYLSLSDSLVRLLLACLLFMLFFLLNAEDAGLKGKMWNRTEASAQKVEEEVIIETDLGSENSDAAKSGKTTYKVRPKLKEWKIKGALAALDDAIPEVQAEALHKLDELDALDRVPRPAFAKIARLLDHPTLDIRLIAIETLGKMGELAQEYLPQLKTLLKQENPDIRAAVVKSIGNFGEAGKAYIPQIANLLDDKNAKVRTSAVNALNRLDPKGDTYIPKILTLLEDRNWETRSEAALIFGSLGERTETYVPQVMVLLKDQNWEVRAAAASALGNLGKVAEKAIPQIGLLLKDESWNVRAAAARALGDLGKIAQAYVPQIAVLLKDERWEVRVAAIWALGNLGEEANPYIAQIVAHLSDQDAQVRTAAVEALGNLGDRSKTYLPQVMAMLDDENWEVRAAAARTLGSLDNLANPALPRIVALFVDRDWYVRSSAARAVGSLGESAVTSLPQLASLLTDQDGNVRSAATWSLGNFGEAAKAYKPQILGLLEDPHPGVRYAAARALGNLGEAGIAPIAPVLNPIYHDPSRTVELRFLAHLMGAGKNEVETLLQWVGKPGNNHPDVKALSYQKARETLEVFDKAWEPTRPFEKILADVASQIPLLIQQFKTQWTYQDLPLLRNHLAHLETIGSPQVKAVREVIRYVEIKSSFQRLLWLLLGVGLLHFLLWSVLIMLYPHSRPVRVMFFWNSSIRKLLGCGYISLILSKVPFLRRRLFVPFRTALLTDAALDGFAETTYFNHAAVTRKSSQEILSIQTALPEIKGKLVLEGESGLGKSMFARYIVKQAQRVTVYLPAEKCSEGVVEAIYPKLAHEIKDFKFLKKLISAGALDICIDGLNRVSQRNLTYIIRFMVHSFRGNMLATTQPIAWTPPPPVKTYVLQPLQGSQIEAFLVGCYQMFPELMPMSSAEYVSACQAYLAAALNASQPQAVLTAAQQILSNPMNLTLVALLGVHGKEPDLLHLQEQSYQMMAEAYTQAYQEHFPLEQFSERVYQMRLNDEASFPQQRFPAEIACLEQFAMVCRRQAFNGDGKLTTEWYFRHDKMMEFFIAQAVLRSKDIRFAKHADDPRFRGVYPLLNVLLPPVETPRASELQDSKEEKESVESVEMAAVP